MSPDGSWGARCCAPSRYRRPDCVRPSRAPGTFTGSRGVRGGCFDGRGSAGPPRATPPPTDVPWPATPTSSWASSTRSAAATRGAAGRSPIPGIVFVPPTGRLAGRTEPYRGHEGLRVYFADVARVWEELRSEPDEFIEIDDDRVVCTGRVYAWGVGRVIDAPAGWVWRLRDELVVEGHVYESRRGAYEAAGLPWPPPRR